MPGETEDQSKSNPEHQLKPFNQEHWEEALAGVFARAAIDKRFRQLCLTNPRAAVHEVTPDLALPDDFKVLFVDKSEAHVHTYVLPTSLPTSPLFAEDSLRLFTKEVLDSYTNSWTGTGTPHGQGTGVHCGQGGGSGSGGGSQ